MKYPKFLNKEKGIYTVAPSFPISGDYYTPRYEEAKRKINELGFNIKEAKHVKVSNDTSLLFGVDDEIKAKELIEGYKDNETNILWSVAGGETMVRILDYIDFKELKTLEPKWFIGYSDNTNFGFLLTTLCDVASIYDSNFTTYAAREYDKSMGNCLEILKGNIIEQVMFDKYESKPDDTDPYSSRNFDIDTSWKALNDEKAKMEGRIIGGCLDCLIGLAGTKYDKVKEFAKKYDKDGVILFFEACDLNVMSQLRAYKQLENCGWFDNINGIIIGRPLNKQDFFDLTYEKMLHESFDHLGIPVIYDFDTGHTAPRITIIQGSYVEISYENKKGLYKTLLK